MKKSRKGQCGLSWDKAKKEKVYDDSGHNTVYHYTGKGLVVVDFDARIPKELRSFFKKIKATTTTARGEHYHFIHDPAIEYKNRTKLASNKKVDVRGMGGKIFVKYSGKSKHINYDYRKKRVYKLKDYPLIKAWLDEVAIDKERVVTQERGDVGQMDLKEGKALLKSLKIKKYSDRDEWMRMLASFYHAVGAKGRKAAIKWSKGDSKNFDQGSFDQVWDQLRSGKYGSDISAGTLILAAKGKKENPLDMFSIEEVKPKKDKGPINLNVLPGMLNKELIESRKEQVVLFPGVVVQGMHSFIYGAAGSNKTTVISWIAMEILKKHTNKKVHFWSFDAAQNHESAIYHYCNSDRMMMSVQSTADDYHEYYEGVIEAEADLHDVIIVIDTFKFISRDVNSKNANKDAMHFIKKLQKLGATVISLGHTNKDAIKQSGTAEIEQDSDAILRIDRKIDPMGGVALTIVPAGRARFQSNGITLNSKPEGEGYKYLKSALDTMVIADEVLDIATSVEEQKAEDSLKVKNEIQIKKDKGEIDALIYIIDELDNHDVMKSTKSMIINKAQLDESMGKNLVNRLLRDYKGTFWDWEVFHPSGGGRPTSLYKTLSTKGP